MPSSIEMLNSVRPSPATRNFDLWLDELEFRLCNEDAPLERANTYYIAQGASSLGVGNDGKSANFPFYVETVPDLGVKIREIINSHPEGDVAVYLNRGDTWGYTRTQVQTTGHYQTIHIANITGFTLSSYGNKKLPNPKIDGFVPISYLNDLVWVQTSGTWVQSENFPEVWTSYCTRLPKHAHDFSDSLDDTYIYCGTGVLAEARTSFPLWIDNDGDRTVAKADTSGSYPNRGFGMLNTQTLTSSSTFSSGMLFVKTPNGSGSPPPSSLRFAFMEAAAGSTDFSAININSTSTNVRLNEIDIYGYGVYPIEGNSQNYGIFDQAGGTSGVTVITKCNSYFSSNHVMGCAGGSAPGHVLLIADCKGGYGSMPSPVSADSLSSLFIFFVDNGGNGIMRRNECTYGSIPEFGLRRSAVAFSGHCGAGLGKEHQLYIVDECYCPDKRFGVSMLEAINDTQIKKPTDIQDLSTYNFISRKNKFDGGYNGRFNFRPFAAYVNNRYLNLRQPIANGGIKPFYVWSSPVTANLGNSVFINTHWEHVRVDNTFATQPWFLLRSTTNNFASGIFINCRLDAYGHPSGTFAGSNDNNITGVCYGFEWYNCILNHTGRVGSQARIDITWNQPAIPFTSGGISNCAILAGAWDATNTTSVAGYNAGSGIVEHTVFPSVNYIPSSGDNFFAKGTNVHGVHIDFDIDGKDMPETPAIGPIQPYLNKRATISQRANLALQPSLGGSYSRSDNLGVNVRSIERRDQIFANPWITGAVVDREFIDVGSQFAKGTDVASIPNSPSLHDVTGIKEIINQNRNNKGVSRFSTIVESSIFVDSAVGDLSSSGISTFRNGGTNVAD